MNRISHWITLVLLTVGSATNAQADIIIGFSPDGSLKTMDVAHGSTFSVDLYYVETSTSLAATNGLLSFGTRGTFSSSILQFTTGTVDSAFPVSSTPDGSVAGQVDAFGGAIGASPKASTIHLATLNFTAIGSGTTVISFGDLDPQFDDFSLDDAALTSLDPIVYGLTHPTHNLTINVTAVPEPSTIVLTTAALVLGACVVYRSRRSVSSQAAMSV